MTVVTRPQPVGIAGDARRTIGRAVDGLRSRLAQAGMRTLFPVLAPPLVLAAPVLAWWLVAPARYSAETRLMVDPGAGIADDAAADGDALLFRVDSEINAITSNDVLGRVVDEQRLDRDPAFATSPVGYGMADEAPRPIAIHNLAGRISAGRIGRSYVVALSVTAATPEQAARLSAAVAEAYVAIANAARAQAAAATSEDGPRRLAALAAEVQQAEAALASYRRARTAAPARVDARQMLEVAKTLGAAQARAEAALARRNRIFAATEGRVVDGDVPVATGDETVDGLADAVAAAEARVAELSVDWGDRHPTLIAEKERVAALRARLAAASRWLLAAAQADHAAAVADVDRLSARLTTLQQGGTDTGDPGRLADLERRVAAARAAHAAALAAERASAAAAPAKARIISAAVPPTDPDGPGLPLMLGIALAGGLAIGTGFAATAGGHGSRRVRNRKRLAQAAGAPVLATLPPFAGLSDGAHAALPATPEAIDGAIGLLLTRLRAPARHNGGGPLTILVTGADDARNPPTLALHLGLWAARERQSVILADVDPAGSLSAAVRAGSDDGEDVGRVEGYPGLRLIVPPSDLDRSGRGTFASAVLDAIGGSDVVVIGAGPLGIDPVTERLVGDPRIGAIVVTASASHGDLGRIRDAVAPLAEDPRLALVMTDDPDVRPPARG